MSEWEDSMRDAVQAGARVVLNNQDVLTTTAKAAGQERAMQLSAQIRSSEDLHKFLERYEQNQKEQAAENEKNKKLAIRSFWVSIAATVFGGGSLIVAIIALALQLSK